MSKKRNDWIKHLQKAFLLSLDTTDYSPGVIRLDRRSLLNTLFITALLFAVLQHSNASGATMEEADRFSLSGNHAAAEDIYTKFLKADPNNLKARLKRAHVRSWQGNHAMAQNDFLTILKKHPKNLDALVGLGYSLSWSEKYSSAELRFQEALEIDPSRIDALKGFAYTAFWRGNYDESIRRFQKTIHMAPKDPEAFVGLGNALREAGDHEGAIEVFQQAISLEPERRDALEALDALKAREAPIKAPVETTMDTFRVWEFSLWGGSTSNGGGTGLRTAEIAAWPTQNLRFWLRYDNALSLDNPALVRRGIKIPSLFIGGLANWGKIYTTRLEIGRRNLLNDIEQNLILMEQVIYLSGTASLKAGGLLGRRNDGRTADLNVYAGYSFPLGLHIRVSPTLFFTKTGGVTETEWRLLLPLEYQFTQEYRLGINLASGKIDSVIQGASGNVWSASAMISLPVNTATEGHLLIRQESGPAMGQFTSFSVGITHKFDWR